MAELVMPRSEIRTSDKLLVLTPIIFFLFFCGILANAANGQAVSEAAGASSVSATAAGSAKAAAMPKVPAGPPASAHLVASSGPPPEETNRKALESHAGKDASKLLLRANPVEGQVWIDGKIVGKTPMLLVLAPGKYQVEMRGNRGQTGKRTVDLLPRETREIAVKLEQLYPGHVMARP